MKHTASKKLTELQVGDIISLTGREQDADVIASITTCGSNLIITLESEQSSAYPIANNRPFKIYED